MIGADDETTRNRGDIIQISGALSTIADIIVSQNHLIRILDERVSRLERRDKRRRKCS